MKVSLVNNAEMVIQAKNEADYEKAHKVAAIIIKDSGDDLVIASECPYEFFIHLTACWDNFQAKDFRNLYNVAKKEV